MPVTKSAPHSTGREVSFRLDGLCRWIFLGREWEALTGFPVAHCLGRALADSVHVDDCAHSLETVNGVLRGERYSCRLPLRCLRNDGGSLWMELLGFPTFDAQGRIDGLSGTLADITDRRKGMRALRESEARFRAISEASPLGVCVTDASGHSVYTNAVLRAMADLNAPRYAGFTEGATVDPEDRSRFLASMREAMRSKAPFQSEHRYLHHDRSVVWCRLHAAPILDADQLLGYVHVAEDVTAARLGEDALRRSQERLRLALEGSGVALMDLDLRTGEIFLSEQWTHFTGDDSGHDLMTVDRFVERVHEDDQESLQLAIKETLSGQRPYLRMEYRIRVVGEQWKWIETHARVVERSEAGDALRLTGTHADITERKDLERLQAEFVATVSHELRTPLTSILGALEVVQEEDGKTLGAQAQKFLGIAYKSSARLFNLVNDILDLEKVERGLQTFLFACVALKPLFEQTVDLHDAFARQRNAVLSIEPFDMDLEAWTDSERLMQVLTNLVSNAIKFSPDGGHVTLRAQRWRDRIRIEVIDQGKGIAPEFQARVFQRFAQAEREGKRNIGSGLGLSICKALVERMDGQIGFRTDQGSGTTFFVDLPLAGRATIDEIPLHNRVTSGA